MQRINPKFKPKILYPYGKFKVVTIKHRQFTFKLYQDAILKKHIWRESENIDEYEFFRIISS